MILGGAWNDPEYLAALQFALSPFDRSPENGFRCVRYLSESLPETLVGSVAVATADYRGAMPVSDEVFEVFRRQFSYVNSGELNASVQVRDESSAYSVRERVVFDAPYGGEQVIAQLFLPKGFEPPYQVVVGFAGLGAFQFAGSSDEAGLPDFVVRSGRALVLPVYKGSFERWDGIVSLTGEETLLTWRDRIVEWYQDLASTLDYLETRPELDLERVAYFGGSFGANAPLPLLAVEPRLKAAILASGGLSSSIPKPPEADPVNYLPRINMPVLMVNGRYDYLFPVETTQVPLMDLLGTPEEHKRHRIVDAAHSVPLSDLIRETLDWLDKYLGPVD